VSIPFLYDLKNSNLSVSRSFEGEVLETLDLRDCKQIDLKEGILRILNLKRGEYKVEIKVSG
jgi:hypothetical protein